MELTDAEVLLAALAPDREWTHRNNLARLPQARFQRAMGNLIK